MKENKIAGIKNNLVQVYWSRILKQLTIINLSETVTKYVS